MFYAGIGSRETPVEWCHAFTQIAKELSQRYGAVLRSGHADGADWAFEDGCNQVYGKKEIFLPWRMFNNSNSDLVVVDPNAFRIAEQYTPYWGSLKDSVRKLFARNAHQVLGWSLDSKSNFVVCWTKDGKDVGGTRLALAIAKANGVQIFNAGFYSNDYQRFISDVLTYADSVHTGYSDGGIPCNMYNV